LEKHSIFNHTRERELEKHSIFNHTRKRELEKHSIFNYAREREQEKHSIFNPKKGNWKNTAIAIMPKEGSWKSTAVAITPKERKWKKAGTEPASKNKVSRNRKNKLGKITLHILCAPADHHSLYRRWTNYSTPCNPITPRTPNYNVVFLVWFAPSNVRKKSNLKIRNKDTEP